MVNTGANSKIYLTKILDKKFFVVYVSWRQRDVFG